MKVRIEYFELATIEFLTIIFILFATKQINLLKKVISLFCKRILFYEMFDNITVL